MNWWRVGDDPWELANDPDYEANGAMARFFYWVCDQTFRIGEWFAWGRFQ